MSHELRAIDAMGDDGKLQTPNSELRARCYLGGEKVQSLSKYHLSGIIKTYLNCNGYNKFPHGSEKERNEFVMGKRNYVIWQNKKTPGKLTGIFCWDALVFDDQSWATSLGQ